MNKDQEAPFILQLQGYRLITAEILYHLPDYPKLLQSYIWQDYDLSPGFPELNRFLNFWMNNIDGKLHTVKVATKEIIYPNNLTYIDKLLTIHQVIFF